MLFLQPGELLGDGGVPRCGHLEPGEQVVGDVRRVFSSVLRPVLRAIQDGADGVV